MILLTGGSGQVGRSILDHQSALSLPCLAPSSRELDLADRQSITDYLESHKLRAIINAGAYTAVDQAENDIERASAINSDAPATLAQYCKVNLIPLIHISTDYVFSGDKSTSYDEHDATHPLSVYGRTKLAGEQAVLASGCRALILRTAWVASPFGKNFIKTMVRLAQERGEIRVVADQYGSPTGAKDLAEVALTILPQLLNNHAAPQGLYHCTNTGETTWAQLARAVMAASASLGGSSASIVDIATADYPTTAKRPHNSRLSCVKLQRDWGITLRPWQDMVKEVVAAVLHEEGQTL